MKQFYNVFSDEKVSPMATQLTWSHYTELLTIKNEYKLKYFINVCIEQHLTKRELREKIKNKEYERLPEETKSKLVNEEKIAINELVHDPIIIKNKSNKELATEKALHDLIMEDIESFMKE